MTTNQNLTVRRASERGHADHGWLKSAHSFSFADYYDPAHMGYRSLRVINDDSIAPGGGFPTHPHRDMEIFSYVLDGALAHEDSLGNKSVLRPGDIQVMRAGSGVLHSEFNPSSTGPARLLQVWILPNERGLAPAYTEYKAPSSGRAAGKQLVISPDGRDGSATIAQDAEVYTVLLKAETAAHSAGNGRGLWLQIAEGAANVNGIALTNGDAVSLEGPGEITITASENGLNALLFDLS